MKVKMSAAVFTIFAWLAAGTIDPGYGLEPGKQKQGSESIEEIRPHNESSTTEKEPEDASWIPEAVLDVAYYLRKHKNYGYDPRYLVEFTARPRRNLYRGFPDPPLKTLQWEVKKNCEPSFVECLKFIQDKVSQMVLPRHLDSLTVIKHNGWTMDKDADLMNETNKACLTLRERDEKTFSSFRGPLQKFQWLISASYYMCWYTLRGNVHLTRFRERCDNFANCMDWNIGPYNGDIRADNDLPFACALYSFCPDPCCPVRLARKKRDCRDANPCNAYDMQDLVCEFPQEKNRDFDSLMRNWWNVSCPCDEPGTRWESRSGRCVDIDECTERPNACPEPSHSCMNLPGTYSCVCNMMGYRDNGKGQCLLDTIVHGIIYPAKIPQVKRNKSTVETLLDFVYGVKSALSAKGDGRKIGWNYLPNATAPAS